MHTIGIAIVLRDKNQISPWIYWGHEREAEEREKKKKYLKI